MRSIPMNIVNTVSKRYGHGEMETVLIKTGFTKRTSQLPEKRKGVDRVVSRNPSIGFLILHEIKRKKKGKNM